MANKGTRKANGSFERADSPAILIRRCQQLYGDLYTQETGARDLTKQQLLVLEALEDHEGASQTALVEMTGIDRSTLAEMVRRMLEKGLVSRKRTESDQRANALAITQGGRKALRFGRTASERAEKRLLDPLPPAERARLLKLLGTVAAAAETLEDVQPPKGRRKPARRARG